MDIESCTKTINVQKSGLGSGPRPAGAGRRREGGRSEGDHSARIIRYNIRIDFLDQFQESGRDLGRIREAPEGGRAARERRSLSPSLRSAREIIPENYYPIQIQMDSGQYLDSERDLGRRRSESSDRPAHF